MPTSDFSPSRSLVVILLCFSCSTIGIAKTVSVQTSQSKSHVSDSVENLQAGLERCEKVLGDLQNRAKADCKYAGVTRDVCDAVQQQSQDKWKLLQRQCQQVPQAVIGNKERACRNLQTDYWACTSDMTQTMGREGTEGVCGHYKTEAAACWDQANKMRGPGPFPAEFCDPDLARVREDYERLAADHEKCLAQLARHDECAQLLEQAGFTSEACQNIRESLAQAKIERQQQVQQQQALQQQLEQEQAGSVRIFSLGNVPDTAGQKITYQGELVKDSTGGGQGRYLYQWFVNRRAVQKGYDMTTFTFPIPDTGETKIGLRIFKTTDGGKTWTKVGQAEDQIWAQNKPDNWAREVPPENGGMPPQEPLEQQPQVRVQESRPSSPAFPSDPSRPLSNQINETLGLVAPGSTRSTGAESPGGTKASAGPSDWVLVATLSDPNKKSERRDYSPLNYEFWTIGTGHYEWTIKKWDLSQDGKNTRLPVTDCTFKLTMDSPPGVLRPDQVVELHVRGSFSPNPHCTNGRAAARIEGPGMKLSRMSWNGGESWDHSIDGNEGAISGWTASRPTPVTSSDGIYKLTVKDLPDQFSIVASGNAHGGCSRVQVLQGRRL